MAGQRLQPRGCDWNQSGVSERSDQPNWRLPGRGHQFRWISHQHGGSADRPSGGGPHHREYFQPDQCAGWPTGVCDLAHCQPGEPIGAESLGGNRGAFDECIGLAADPGCDFHFPKRFKRRTIDQPYPKRYRAEWFGRNLLRRGNCRQRNPGGRGGQREQQHNCRNDRVAASLA